METALIDNGYNVKNSLIKIFDFCLWCLNRLKRIVYFTFSQIIIVILSLTCFCVFLLLYNPDRTENVTQFNNGTKLREVLNYPKKNAENQRIAIIVAIQKKSDYNDYELGLDTIKCYANFHGYQFHLLTLIDVPEWSKNCNQTDVFFKRHCAVVNFFEKNVNTIDYALYLDADMGVINPNHTIQEYLQKDDDIEITFYDRYYNHEIMAGSYLIKNTKYARGFLKYWADYFYRLPNSFHGTDNGCIHQVFMEQHFKANNTLAQKCYPLWANSRNYEDLFRYQACTRHYLGMNRTTFCDGKVRIIRKGTWGFSRDGWLTQTRWAPSDFIFHGWKKSKLGHEWQWPFKNKNFDLRLCHPNAPYEANWQYKKEFQSTDVIILKELIARRDEVNQKYLKDINAIRKYIV